MTCERTLGGLGGLVCTRADAHDAEARGGHTFEASAGPDLDEPKHHATGDEQ